MGLMGCTKCASGEHPHLDHLCLRKQEGGHAAKGGNTQGLAAAHPAAGGLRQASTCHATEASAARRQPPTPGPPMHPGNGMGRGGFPILKPWQPQMGWWMAMQGSTAELRLPECCIPLHESTLGCGGGGHWGGGGHPGHATPSLSSSTSTSNVLLSVPRSLSECSRLSSGRSISGCWAARRAPWAVLDAPGGAVV